MASPWYIPNISVLDFLRTNAANDIGSPSYYNNSNL